LQVPADPLAVGASGSWSVGSGPVATTSTPPRRRRRWPLVLSGLLLLALTGTLVALALTSDDDTTVVADGDAGSSEGGPDDAGPDGAGPGAADPDGPGAGPDDADPEGGDGDGADDGDRDGGAEQPSRPELDPEDVLDPLDLDGLDGTDLVFGRLLTTIDASEQEMIAFQAEVGQALAGASSRDAGLEAVAEVAATRERGLLDVRERLEDPLDDPGAEEVRALYVDHLDSWAELMGDVADEPLRILDQSESGATVSINLTADRFARALEAELPADADTEVARFADDLLDRGFRGGGVADV